MGILTKSDVLFDSFRCFRVVDEDGVTHWYVTVGYDVTTVESEVIHRDKQLEITNPGQKAILLNLLNTIKAQIRTNEGI